MAINDNLEVLQQLRKLETHISDTIIKMLYNGKIASYQENYSFWEIDGFNYTPDGIRSEGSTLRKVIHKNWSWAILRINEVVRNDVQFLDLKDKLFTEIREADKNALESYCDIVIERFLHSLTTSGGILLDDVRSRFIRDLNDAPFNTKVFVELEGLTLETDSIRLDQHTTIRRTTKTDLEIPRPTDDFGRDRYGPNHTAIMDINYVMTIRNPTFLQNEYAKRMVLLHLFCTGSIIVNSCEFSSDLVVQSNIGGKVGSNNNYVWKNYYLKSNAEALLQHFFKAFKIPQQLYVHNNNPDHLTVAFDRYKESLLEIVKFERRIANVVMGIEALLSNDTMELKFRMKTRVARLLGCLGHPPISVRENVGKAYDVRSTFAHGNFLSKKENDNLLKTYGALDDFSLIVINYLRILLIVFIGCGLSKNQLICLIDDSLIDEISHQRLKDILQPLEQFLVYGSS